jgi:hypothetical protein
VNLQPLQSNLKVLQEQQTQTKHSMVSSYTLVNSERVSGQRAAGKLLARLRLFRGGLAPHVCGCAKSTSRLLDAANREYDVFLPPGRWAGREPTLGCGALRDALFGGTP